MKKQFFTAAAVFTMALATQAQNVNIPDANFKALLLANSAINTDSDPTEISYAEAGVFTGTIVVSNQNIADLTGIEAFTALTGLICEFNQLTSLDISNNTALTQLRCSYNQLTSLDVSNNTALIILNCENNQLTNLDVSNNTTLYELYCHNNQLTSLNVANGNNQNFISFKAENNPDLDCIQIDDTDTTGYNWIGSYFNFDSGVSFSDNCVTVGISEVNQNNITTVYPNPAHSTLNIEVKETVNIKIVNLLGASLATQQLNAGNNSIDVSNLTKGVYFLQTDKGGAVQFVKE